jgi:hypothetical protein
MQLLWMRVFGCITYRSTQSIGKASGGLAGLTGLCMAEVHGLSRGLCPGDFVKLPKNQFQSTERSYPGLHLAVILGISCSTPHRSCDFRDTTEPIEWRRRTIQRQGSIAEASNQPRPLSCPLLYRMMHSEAMVCYSLCFSSELQPPQSHGTGCFFQAVELSPSVPLSRRPHLLFLRSLAPCDSPFS